MSDADILAFGCAVSFVFLGGAYVIVRERLRDLLPPSEGSVSAPRPPSREPPAVRDA